MSTDVSGMIECRPLARIWGEDDEDAVWHAAIDLFLLNTGNAYDALACLFGIRNSFRFRPLTDDRGLPADASTGLRGTFNAWGRPQDAHGTIRHSQPEYGRRDGDSLGAGLGRVAHAWRGTWPRARATRGLVRLIAELVSVPRHSLTSPLGSRPCPALSEVRSPHERTSAVPSASP